MANWRRDMERKMIARGYETAIGSERESAAMLQLGRRPPANQPTKAELRRLANAKVAEAIAEGLEIERLPDSPRKAPKPEKFTKPKRWRRKVRE